MGPTASYKTEFNSNAIKEERGNFIMCKSVMGGVFNLFVILEVRIVAC